MNNSLERLIFVAGLVLILGIRVPGLDAQTDRGTIVGTVTDSSGAVIAGASVTATHVATNTSSSVTTGEDGSYTFPLLRVGVYRVTVEHTGFKQYVGSDITVNVGQTARVDTVLEVGQVTESVAVTSEMSMVEPATSDRGTVISGKDVVNLPLVGVQEVRNPAFLITLSPGVNSRGTVKESPSGGGRQLNTTVNGSMSGSIEWQLDGAVIGQSRELSGDFRQLPFPPDVVGEFKVMTLLPPAEFGQTGLGITSFTLKSGSNGFHGVVYEFFRNTVLDARGFYATATPKNNQNEFGATIGGPIRKDKTFFYGWYNGFRDVKLRGANDKATLPTAAMKGGDLSNILGGQIGADAFGRAVYSSEIYDPATTRIVPAGAADPATGLVNTSGTDAVLRDGFGFNPTSGLPIPGQANIIPKNRIDPVAARMFSYFVDPPACPSCNFGYQRNWLGPYLTRDSINDYGIKLDQVFSNKNRLNGSYIWKSQYAPTGSTWPGAISDGTDSTNGWRILRLSHDYFIRQNLINHSTFGFNRTRNDGFTQAGTGWPAVLGYSGVPQGGIGSSFPQLNIGGIETYGGGSQYYDAGNNFAYDDSLTWIKGRHTIKGGFSYIKLQHNGLETGAQSSSTVYQSGTTGLLDEKFYNFGNCAVGDLCTGVGVAGFLLGLPTSGTATITASENADRMGRYGVYVQDDFKLSSKLTLNLGFRYDLFKPTVDAHDIKTWFDPLIMNTDLGVPGILAYATPERRTGAANEHGSGPRFGFAFSLNAKTVLRGGYGILYTTGGGTRSLEGSLSGSQLGYSASNYCGTSGYAGFDGSTSCSPPGYGDVHMKLETGWPAHYYKPLPFVSQNYYDGLGPTTFGAWPGDERAPQMQNAAFGIQRQLPGQILLDVGYVWTKGTNLSSRLRNSNVVPTKYIGFGADLFKNIADPAIQALPVVQAMPIDPATGMHSPFAGFEELWKGSATLGQALRPFPQYQIDTIHPASVQMKDFGETTGMSTYNALQISARKNLSYGLTFLVAYTWSKTLTNAGSLFNEFSGFTQDFYNAAGEKALSVNDYPSNLVFSYQYELPFGPGKKWANKAGAAGKVLGGWSIAGIQQYRSGAPQMIASTGNSLFPYMSNNGFTTRPNVVPGVEKKSAAILNGTWDPNGIGEAGSRFNINAWADPAPYTFGNAPVTDGAIRQLPFYQEDFSIKKQTYLNDHVSIEFRVDFLNAFNRVLFSFDQGGDQYGNLIGGGLLSGGVGSFGHEAGQTNPPREIQFGLKINY